MWVFASQIGKIQTHETKNWQINEGKRPKEGDLIKWKENLWDKFKEVQSDPW